MVYCYFYGIGAAVLGATLARALGFGSATGRFKFQYLWLEITTSFRVNHSVDFGLFTCRAPDLIS